MHPRDRIEYRSAALRAAGQWRDPQGGVAADDGADDVVDVRSNDYLGLGRRVVSRETLVAAPRVGAGASRIVSGTWPAHLALEAAISGWLQTTACLLFSSGYAANVGAVSALAGPGEIVFSDALNHASIIDGCRLSRAEVVVLPHGDVDALARALSDTRGVRWVVTETYFGMDGDTPDLRRIRALCDAHGAALVVDEAHALGVFGPEGRGLCAEAGVTPDVVIGGMGKALGVQGGFVACDRVYRDWLWNRARSMVFSTAPSPVLCEHALEQVERVRTADAERARLRRLEARLAERLAAAGVATTPGRHGPVFPIVFGSEAAVLEAAARAAARGLKCQPIRPPTVPAGKSRLRVILRADLSDANVERLADGLIGVWNAAAADPSGEGHSPRPASSGRSGSSHASQTGQPQRHNEEPVRSDAPDEPEVLGSSTPLPRGPMSSSSPRVSHATDEAVGRRQLALAARTWIVLGTGTGVGKTFAAAGFVNSLASAGLAVAGLKPVETGLGDLAPEAGDAARLAGVSFHVKQVSPHPLYGYSAPVAPSRAARVAGDTIDLARIVHWVRAATAYPDPSAPLARVVETAGGVFSPLGPTDTNFELARALDPATWILVAPDRLGVLHDVTSCLCAMSALGRLPDWLILSAPSEPDASTGTNAQELARLRACPPIIELPRNDPTPLRRLLTPSS